MSPRNRSTYVTDLRHFLDEDGLLAEGIPAPAENLALHIGAIVSWMTHCPPQRPELTNVRCRRSPGRRRCIGQIVADLLEDRRTIVWECPLCGDNGYITGWENSYFVCTGRDRRH